MSGNPSLMRPATTPEDQPYLDPVIEHYKRRVDLEAIRRNLKLTPQERFERLQSAVDEMSRDAESPTRDSEWSDPIIERYKKDVDVTLIRECLKRTVEQRFDALMQLQEFAHELRGSMLRTPSADR